MPSRPSSVDRMSAWSHTEQWHNRSQFWATPMPTHRYVGVKGSAAVLAGKRSAGVAPEVNLGKCIVHNINLHQVQIRQNPLWYWDPEEASPEFQNRGIKKNILFLHAIHSVEFKKLFQEQQQQLGLKFEALESDEELDKESVALKQGLQAEGKDSVLSSCLWNKIELQIFLKGARWCREASNKCNSWTMSTTYNQSFR